MQWIYRDRLRRLALGLMTVPQEHFGMWGFGSIRLVRGQFTQTVCGTPGCALGWAPAILGMRGPGSQTWDWWCGRVLGLRAPEHFWGSTEWETLFDCKWGNMADAPKEAAARILYWLETGNKARADHYMEYQKTATKALEYLLRKYSKPERQAA